jgi:hypothetical protein
MSHLGEKDFTNRLDYIQAQKDLIHKGLYGGLPCEDLIIKGGEGSKGGKVIGHTKSGKPIYANANHPEHKDFTSGEHQEAADTHFQMSKKRQSAATPHHMKQIKHHVDKQKEAEGGKEGTFEHHRMMAGYHASKEQEIADTQEDFRSSSDKQLHESADEMEAERKKHQDKEHEHKEKAKKLHDPKKHGDWNSTLPKEKDALEYGAKHDVKKAEGDNFDGTFDKAMTAEAGEGVTQKESVEHNPKDMQNAKPSDLKKAYEILGLNYQENDIQKGGIGSGKKLGQTASGKHIFTSSFDKPHGDFSQQDHEDAERIHRKEADKFKSKKTDNDRAMYKHHAEQAQKHSDAANINN